MKAAKLICSTDSANNSIYPDLSETKKEHSAPGYADVIQMDRQIIDS